MSVNETIAELDAARKDVAQRVLRVKSLLRVADDNSTISKLNEHDSFLSQRGVHLLQAQQTLEVLVQHGHPTISKLQLNEAQCKDLETDLDRIVLGLTSDIQCELIGADSVTVIVGPERLLD